MADINPSGLGQGQSSAFTLPSALLMSNAPQVLEQGLQAIQSGIRQFNLSALVDIDSSAIAVCLAWHRAAASQSMDLQLDGIPNRLRSLAKVYDLAEWFA